MSLTDAQWTLVFPLLPEKDRTGISGPRGGRPRVEPRPLFEAMLWVLRTGAPWHDLPARYPPYQTCHRRFQQWVKAGVFERILHTLAEDLHQRGGLDLTECYIDGTHAGAKKGALALDALAADWPPRSWQWQTAMVFLSPWGLQAVKERKSILSKQRSTSGL